MGDDLLNSAFVFVKPHADIPKVQDKVREMLLDKKIEILSEGDISGSTIDEKKLIDQHYYAIASKATLLDRYMFSRARPRFWSRGSETELAPKYMKNNQQPSISTPIDIRLFSFIFHSISTPIDLRLHCHLNSN
mmetsp:Transcript_2625/g.4766  ORF Transcript_2625/g.4766 Transcript_2625/m.4766 type:complete len:134 (+) Transcript_2625:537-938(+)